MEVTLDYTVPVSLHKVSTGATLPCDSIGNKRKLLFIFVRQILCGRNRPVRALVVQIHLEPCQADCHCIQQERLPIYLRCFSHIYASTLFPVVTSTRVESSGNGWSSSSRRRFLQPVRLGRPGTVSCSSSFSSSSGGVLIFLDLHKHRVMCRNLPGWGVMNRWGPGHPVSVRRRVTAVAEASRQPGLEG